jgi:hypothetical protein
MRILVTQASFVPFRHGEALSSLLGNDKLRVITLLTRAAPPSPRLGECAYAYCHCQLSSMVWIGFFVSGLIKNSFPRCQILLNLAHL